MTWDQEKKKLKKNLIYNWFVTIDLSLVFWEVEMYFGTHSNKGFKTYATYIYIWSKLYACMYVYVYAVGELWSSC